MIECDQSSFPLTVAQRGLWFSQKMHPDALMNIAEAVEICGPVKPEVFQQALHRVISEAEQLRVSVIEEDGKPLQVLRSCYEGDLPYIDMSREPDPRAASEAWMRDELRRPVDLAHDPPDGAARPSSTPRLQPVDRVRDSCQCKANHPHSSFAGLAAAYRLLQSRIRVTALPRR